MLSVVPVKSICRFVSFLFEPIRNHIVAAVGITVCGVELEELIKKVYPIITVFFDYHD